jgi:hypothetical protein
VVLGLRLHLVCTPAGMPALWAPVDPKIGKREVRGRHARRRTPADRARPGLTLITGKGFSCKDTGTGPAWCGITLLSPSRKDEPARHGAPLLKAIESLNA